jgi:glucose-6-phosphate dehydrogenase assembly protein OpcA
VQDELNRLWADVKATQGATAGDGDRHADAVAQAAITRANTLNLVAVARSTAEAERIERAVGYLGDFYPARAIVLVADPSRSSRSDEGWDVRVSLLEQAANERPVTRFECVTVEAGAAAASRFASIVSSLLVPELPDFLWWPGDSLTTALFQDLIEIADRLILDSGALADPVMGLRVLAAQTARPHQFPKVTDFTWARLTPWRTLVAQFFDATDVLPCLECIDTVELTYAPQGQRGDSGLTAALLMAGWLGSRLGWTAAAPLERTRTGWQAELRSDASDSVLLKLRPGYDDAFKQGLGAVDIIAKRTNPGSFRVQRITPSALTTSSQTPTMPRVGRMVQAEDSDEADLLGQALHTFGRDPIFEDALRFAAGLFPGAQAGTNGRAGT